MPTVLRSMTTKHNKYKMYVVNQKLEYFDDISFREIFGENQGIIFCETQLD